MSDPAFERILAHLAEAEVRFIIVGGLALGAWGVVRATKDVDVVVDPDLSNLQTLAEVAVSLGGRVETGEAVLGSAPSIAARLASGERTLIETRLGELDVVNGAPNVPAFEELGKRAANTTLLGVAVTVCSLEDLRAMKKSAGRTRDLADLEDLDAAHDE